MAGWKSLTPNCTHGCSVKRTTDQAITNETDTVIQYNVEDFDIAGEWSLVTHRFTVTVAGYYLICSNLVFGMLSDGKKWKLMIRKNGTNIAVGRGSNGTADYAGGGVSSIQSMAVDDYFDIACYHNNGSTTNLKALDGFIAASVMKL